MSNSEKLDRLIEAGHALYGKRPERFVMSVDFADALYQEVRPTMRFTSDSPISRPQAQGARGRSFGSYAGVDFEVSPVFPLDTVIGEWDPF